MRSRLLFLLLLPPLAACVGGGVLEEPDSTPPPIPCATPADCDGAACEGGSCRTTGCGDGKLAGPEECDQGAANGAMRGLCTTDCKARFCGDGRLDPDLDEVCDGEGCNPNCQSLSCGDGALAPEEACDDGNAAAEDGCEPDCGCSKAEAIALGEGTILVRRLGGAHFGWGENKRLLEGAASGVLGPVAVPELPPSVELAAGRNALAVRTAAGEVWRLDGDEPAGDDAGGIDGIQGPLQALLVPGSYARVAAGLRHLVLLGTDGAVTAMGQNDYRQVGQAGPGPYAEPQPVQGLVGRTATGVFAAGDLSFAVLDDGTLWGWGRSDLHQTGAAQGSVAVARQLPLLSGCEQVRTNGMSVFALCGGGWWGWGLDDHREVSAATGVASEACGGSQCTRAPTPCAIPFAAAELAVGWRSVYALDDSGELWGWGEGRPVDGGDVNALGTGIGGEAIYASPVRLPLPGPHRAIAAGHRSGLVLQESGTLYAVGDRVGLGRVADQDHSEDWLPVDPLCAAR